MPRTCPEFAMSEPVRHLLDLFDTLPESDDIPDDGLDSLAGELFAALDSVCAAAELVP
jgi:hypothetical protein